MNMADGSSSVNKVNNDTCVQVEPGPRASETSQSSTPQGLYSDERYSLK